MEVRLCTYRWCWVALRCSLWMLCDMDILIPQRWFADTAKIQFSTGSLLYQIRKMRIDHLVQVNQRSERKMAFSHEDRRQTRLSYDNELW
ncbi:unnamed protein product [Callosobruchus maculatus]|uniref:Uncharacterized protein n=1 Tax=Callosobruchus maculatus TaxID=64391 RepID=A0A653CMY1_CALMS|nr:unnamed protein product [Callosobruchus maculatus]